MRYLMIEADPDGRLWCGPPGSLLPDDPDAAMERIGTALRTHRWEPAPKPYQPGNTAFLDRRSVLTFSFRGGGIGWCVDGYPHQWRGEIDPAVMERLSRVVAPSSVLRQVLHSTNLLTALVYVWNCSLSLPRSASGAPGTPTVDFPLAAACPPLALVVRGIPANRARLYAAACVDAEEAQDHEAAGTFDADTLRMLAALRHVGGSEDGGVPAAT